MTSADRRDNETRKRAVDRMADKVVVDIVNNCQVPSWNIDALYDYVRCVAHKAVDQDRRWRARRAR